VRIIELPLDYIFNDEFDQRGVGARILASLPDAERSTKKTRAPADIPAYIAALYEVPLLTREQEVHLFRKFNFLKYKMAKLRGQLDPSHPTTTPLDAIEELYDEAVKTKYHILRANLRLVVAVARNRTSPSQDSFELISDGNVSLVRIHWEPFRRSAFIVRKRCGER
jgi:DNA-directed RNA polymerase sigma subunit (sigma70/sigma32)